MLTKLKAIVLSILLRRQQPAALADKALGTFNKALSELHAAQGTLQKEKANHQSIIDATTKKIEEVDANHERLERVAQKVKELIE